MKPSRESLNRTVSICSCKLSSPSLYSSLRKQYKTIKESYEKWLEQSAKTEADIEMPDIVVKVPKDEAETSVVHDEW
jgi:hypothetical protein